MKALVLAVVAAVGLAGCTGTGNLSGAQQIGLTGAGTGAAAGPGQASVTAPGQNPTDPTRGQLINNTPFRVQVYIDSDPNRAGSGTRLTLEPGQVVPFSLDVGTHRVIGIAIRDTQFGPRTVGRLDRPLHVDVRGSGWEMRLNEGDFR